ncbi:MAG: twin-arginine translocase subunit TatC [Candidatus Fermentibacteria bacterium]|nr:twin-arginine translocase subunit TatC [Candidatus Fermentibacteria bacterium]
MAVNSVDGGSFWDHLEEFRKRIFIMIITVGVLAATAFFFSRYITNFVTTTSPCDLIALAPAEAITAHLKLSVTVGIILASPVLIFQIWRFVAPGLYRTERKGVISVTIAGSLLFIGGAAFAWFVMRKPALLLFQSFETGNIHGAWSVSAYIGFIGSFLLVFGAAFQLPLAVLFLAKTGIIEPSTLGKYRRHVVVGLLIMSAILTPPDPLTQVMLALPLYILFEISLVAARISFRKAKSASEKTATTG